MATEQKHITISKNNSGFPAYLDFEKLRSEGIDYLGRLSGKIWTDHNVHDPGITILEVLCYALLDLGYRTNLPVEDILARDPADASPDDNFFTPAQILSCNPLTIADYRKLLIDIPGVRNAWLEPAIDIKDICRRAAVVIPNQPGDHIPGTVPNPQAATSPLSQDTCVSFLNGLYHVYIETEKDPDKDFRTQAEKKKYTDDIIKLVKDALMQHRNLCEDFEDIYILCKMDTGVCLSVELEDTADAENVYLDIATHLREFLSPAPKFYTLPQLLDKGKAIEDIFAGRPYSPESHGFVDTDELENLQLKKEIHTSDVYNVIFDVEGVKKISRLELKSCGKDCPGDDKTKRSHWKFNLPKNHIPSFSIACSGIEFTRNGLPVNVDTQKFETLLALNFSHNGKVKYALPSPYLDNPIPNGIYHSDLEDYYSIQHDFPRVYGIGEGELPDDASDERKAQALQLKGYLLFFDQMLANYLSQLKHIRQLFALKSPAGIKDQHTYFLNTLKTVPEMEKLLRFGSAGSDTALGVNGTVLVFPVSREDWELVNTTLRMGEELLRSFTPYQFNSLTSLEEATALLRDGLEDEKEITTKAWRTFDDCWLFTLSPAEAGYVLLGAKMCATETEALQQAASVQYTGLFDGNYRSFLMNGSGYSFNIELNIASYTDYLGMLVESDELYISRRKKFLSHLLSRFAEKFTDFALLNWKSGSERTAVGNMERFLTQYDDISRNRGRGYDYLEGGWNNDNISGFEKKIKALAGMSSLKKDYLCHFTVDLYDEQFILDLSKAGIAAFRIYEKYDLQADALQAAADMVSAMKDAGNYKVVYQPDKKQYQLQLHYGATQPAVHAVTFSNSNNADELVAYLSQGTSQQAPANTVLEYSWNWKGELSNSDGKIIRVAADVWHTEKQAQDGIKKLLPKINIPKAWQAAEKDGGLVFHHDKRNSDTHRFIDLAGFNIDISDTIIGKPGMFTYDVLDKDTNSFKISPSVDFETGEQAREHCADVLTAAADRANFIIKLDKENRRYQAVLQQDGVDVAASAAFYTTREETEKAIAHMSGTNARHLYTLGLVKTPASWKFRYRLGYEAAHAFEFYSVPEYKSFDEATAASSAFHGGILNLGLKENAKQLQIVPLKDKQLPAVAMEIAEKDTRLPAIRTEWEQQQQIAKLAAVKDPRELATWVAVDGVNQQGTYVYKLVNKNRVPAFFTQPFAAEDTAWNQRKIVASLSKNMIRKIPQVCLGGDIFSEVIDRDNNLRYRYQVKLHNQHDAAGKELVLFESVQAYGSEEEAYKAFQDHYLHILTMAAEVSSYGKQISLVPVEVPVTGDCMASDAVVYVPAATLKWLLDKFGATWMTNLAGYLATYPIKVIDSDSEKFACLFCKTYEQKVGDCKGKPGKWVYYFTLPVNDSPKLKNVQGHWQSTGYYETPGAAMEDFLYFVRLLKYTGNYYVDCGCAGQENASAADCVSVYAYRIFIREVLAQSIDWFTTKEQAWGKEGIEKFICAVQSGNAFRNYLRRTDCCYSFYVTCGSGLLDHPCKYDTEKQRDEALQLLYDNMQVYSKNKSYSVSPSGNVIMLNDFSGKPFANVQPGKITERDFCDIYIRLAETIMTTDITVDYTKDGHLSAGTGTDGIHISSVEQRMLKDDQEIAKWKTEWLFILKNWACHYPIVRVQLNPGAGENEKPVYKYCIEIKLPGFNSCMEDAGLNKPCGCDEKPGAGEGYCHIAWKGNCCYPSCSLALEAYEKALQLLAQKSFYHPVFDCECHSFGIALHIQQSRLVTVRGEQGTTATAGQWVSDIIAVNPQCYDTTKEVCIAVDTARQLVNSEGLHLAEHILLRPHCDRDCDCRKDAKLCTAGCSFPPYKIDEDDPCSSLPGSVCFEPGADPYSFIVTIALPAWSARFRDAGSRSVIENYLYREAPAHVLLRILWLKPRDFCEFEFMFKKWNQWLTGTTACGDRFDRCDFLHLLFDRTYDCLDECTDCQPCKEPALVPVNDCFKNGRSSLKENPNGFVNQVHDIYCLPRYCDRGTVPVPLPAPGSTLPQVKRKVQLPPAQPVVAESKKMPVEKKEDKAVDVKVTPVAEAEVPDQRQRAQVINTRMKRYQKLAVQVLEHSKGNPSASKMQALLSGNEPSADAIDKLAVEIIQNKKPAVRGAKILNSHQQLDLLQAAICYYLDKVSFNGKDPAKLAQLQKTVTRLVKAGIDVQHISNYWDAAEIEKYEPGMDTEAVKQLLSANKKKK
jgi:hypothetical protein